MEGLLRSQPGLQVSSVIANRSAAPLYVTSNLELDLDAGKSESYPGSGGSWFDLSGNSRTFTLTNTTFSSANGGCITFNGTNARATISQSTSPFRRTDAITYEFFLQRTSGGSDNLAGVNVANGQGTGGVTMSATAVSFTWTPSSPLSDRSISSSLTSNKLNFWTHFVFTVNYSTQSYAIFENAFQLTSTPNGSWTTMSPSTAYQRADIDSIGARYINSWLYWAGSIAVCRIYSRRLEPFEVQQNFNSARNRFNL
jgi:hypothetical protein